MCAFAPADTGASADVGPMDDAAVDADTDANEVELTEPWASGETPLLAVLAADAGIWVVSEETAILLGADGTEVHRFEPGRVITAAAFRDGKLYVVDRAEVAIIEGTTVTSTYRLPEWCGRVIPLSENHLVCVHGERDSNYTLIDLSANVVRSSGFLSGGLSNADYFLLPSEDRFASVSSSTYNLFDLVTDEVTWVARYSVNTSAVAFTGSPATRLVTGGGRMLWVDLMYCAPEDPAPECLERAGDLGVLPVDESYISMTSTPNRIYGLLRPRSANGNCESGGCALHEVDSVERRRVRTWDFHPATIFESEFSLLREAFPLVHDTSRNRILFAVHVTMLQDAEAWRIYEFSLD